MIAKERVLAAIYHRIPDRVPMGELFIDPRLVEEAFPNKARDQLQATRQFIETLHLDLVVCHHSPFVPTEDFFNQIRWWHEETDLFIFALVGGGISCLWPYWGFLPFLIATQKQPSITRHWIKKMVELNTYLASKAIESGADGIIIGDDIAYNRGLFFPLQALRELLFPYLAQAVKTIKGQGIPVFFHSDGNINEIIPEIIGLGFDGLQCLQPSAGMDLKAIKERYGKQLCLMGTLELNKIIILNRAAELEKEVKNNLISGASGGGYIFGTCSGLTPQISLNTLRLIYDTTLKYGQYNNQLLEKGEVIVCQ
jgi:uroporphyrinogen decarboxylase